MLREHSTLVRNSLAFGDLLAAFVSFSGSLALRARLEPSTGPFTVDESTLITLLGASVVSLWIGYRLSGIYRSRRLRPFHHEAAGILLANLATFMLLLAVVAALGLSHPNRIQLGLFICINTALVIGIHLIGRLTMKHFRRQGYNSRYLVLAGNATEGLHSVLEKVNRHGWWGFRTAAAVTPSGGRADDDVNLVGTDGNLDVFDPIEGERVLDRQPIDEVWVDGFPEPGGSLERFLSAARERGVSVRHIVSEDSVPGSRWGFEQVGGMQTLTTTSTPVDELALCAKRAIDIVGALVALLLFAPVMTLAAIWVKAEDKGPIFFRQVRVGHNGRRFVMFKFRSMVQDAEQRLSALRGQNEMSGPVFKMSHDPRITRIGRWLRKLSIDEMPQLFNVLGGEMSLVGPRPPIPSEVDLYSATQRRRLSVKPGITGLWQVTGRSEIEDFEKWVELDLEYIDHWSIWLDLSILLKTVPAVLATKGAK